MISDPLFYATAVPAVLIVGIAKGGFGGGLGIMAVPLMALLISPIQAAAIMLPILCFMDLIGVWAYWRKWDSKSLGILVAAAMLGIAVGALTFRYLAPSTIRLLIGAIALGFTLNYWFGRATRAEEPRGQSWRRGGLWAGIAGFTSFTAHAGGPPLSVYLLSRRLDKTTYQATTVIFFLLINYVKLLPYAWLGQFTEENLWTAAALFPIAIVGMLGGIWLHDRVPQGLFYRLCYAFLFLAGLKLVYDGLTGL